MDSIRVFCDSIKTVVNVSCKCAEAKSECPTNWQDLAIVGIIAVASVVIIGFVCKKVCDILKMKKYEGIKIIVEDILKEMNVTPDGIKTTVEEVLEEKEKQSKENGK